MLMDTFTVIRTWKCKQGNKGQSCVSSLLTSVKVKSFLGTHGLQQRSQTSTGPGDGSTLISYPSSYKTYRSLKHTLVHAVSYQQDNERSHIHMCHPMGHYTLQEYRCQTKPQ